MAQEKRAVPWFLRPFWAVRQLTAWVVGLTGRLVAAALGLALMVARSPAPVTVVGALVGVPLMFLAFPPAPRGLF